MARRSVVVGALVLVAACGGGDATSTTTTSTTATTSVDATTTTVGTTTTAASATYTVQPGDTLFDIARRFGSTVDALVEANDISDPDLITPGQVLEIPPGA